MENETTDVVAQAGTPEEAPLEDTKKQTGTIIGISVGALILVAAIIAFAVFLLTGSNETTERIRDVFIIFMALESMVIGLVLIILVVQLARLTNLLQNEIKPIMDSTNETVSTIRGTTQFLSDHMVEPVIKINEYIAGLTSFLKIIRPARKK